MKRTDPSADLDMAMTYVESRFLIDSCQRLEAGVGLVPQPQFILVRTRLGCFWRFRSDLGRGPIRELAKLAGREGNGAAAFEAALPPERVEPMLRVLQRASLDVTATRDLLVRRVGWTPAPGNAPTELFRIDTPEAEGRSTALSARAQMGSIRWEHRRALAQFDANQWTCFADLVEFVDVQSN